jgi:quercetin dioxygenase-like cupin family protein
LLLATLLSLALSATGVAVSAGQRGVDHTKLTEQKLANVPGHSLTALIVEIAPGGLSPAHRHAGFVFAYVLAGTVRSQLDDGPAVVYRTGESWVEPPGTVHCLTENPSPTEPARLLAVFVAPEGATLTTFEP